MGKERVPDQKPSETCRVRWVANTANQSRQHLWAGLRHSSQTDGSLRMGAEPPPSDWGPLQSLVLTKMKDFHGSTDHRLLPLCYLPKKVFARAQGLDSRHATNILGISTTPTSIMTTPNKLFFSEACGLLLANPSPWCPSSWPIDQSRLGQEQHLVSSSKMMALNWLNWI